MAKLNISPKIKRLNEFRRLKELFGEGYLRQVDKYLTIEHKGEVYLINTFFVKNMIKMFDIKWLGLLELFSTPLSFVVFLDKLRHRFSLKYGNPSREEFDKIRELLKFTNLLIEEKFLVQNTFNEYTQLQKMRLRTVRRPMNLNTVYIIPTTRCNFRCKGCFIYAGDWKKKGVSTMTQKTFDRQLRFLKKFIPIYRGKELDQHWGKGESVVSFIFYGGEPLLNKGLVEYAAKRLRQLQQNMKVRKSYFHLAMVTNGSLLDEETADVLKKYDITTSVSLDGVERSHDFQRSFEDGGKTFKLVEKAIKTLDRKGMRHGVSWTIGADNIDSVERDLEWVSKHLRIREVFFNFMLGTKPDEYPLGSIKREIFFKKMHRIYDKIRELGMIESRLERYKRFAEKGGHPYHFYCSALDAGQLTLRPDGKIGVCHENFLHDDFDYQRPEEIADIFEDPVYRRWMNRSPLYKKNCYLNCEYFTLCPGGCERRIEQVTGNREAVIDEVCRVEQFLVERAILELIE